MDAPGGLGGWSASVFGPAQHTYGLDTTQPHVFLPPKHHQHTSIMLQIDIGKSILDVETDIRRGSDFDPFWHPFCCFFLREMTQNLTSHQPLGVFTPIFLQWCLFITRAPKHQKSCNLVQWLIWCGHLTVKNRVHTAAH